MRRGRLTYFAVLIALFLVLLTRCSKEEEDRFSGIDTIESTLYGDAAGYYALGFSFDLGKKIPTNGQPRPDISVHPITDAEEDITGISLETPILVAPFGFAGEFDSGTEASAFYNNLTVATSSSWMLSASPLKENQVWIFRTTEGNYAKFRVIELKSENRSTGAWASVKFEWMVQPDGTENFD
ncbi:MAG: HmuY family protein [Bacteroidales bacterium]|nr:HmuY family protein [Bacteroidales bacterium]